MIIDTEIIFLEKEDDVDFLESLQDENPDLIVTNYL